MPEKNALHLWKEAVSAPSRFREAYRGMYLSVLPQAIRQKPGKELSSIEFSVHDFVLYELKGRPTDMQHVALPVADSELLWLCLQFQGRLAFSDGHVVDSDTVCSFEVRGIDNPITIAPEKIWGLFLGISGISRQQVLGEYPILREEYETCHHGATPFRPITYVERRGLELFAKQSFGSFTTLYHIGHLLMSLYASYARQLVVYNEREHSEPMLLLYHRAIAYIREHYLDADMNRMTIAEALHCSTRNLSRAFEGRSATLNTAIVMIRLHKARELLREQPDLAVDDIAAMLHFPNGKHFATRYKQYFHCTPREERKNTGEWGLVRR